MKDLQNTNEENWINRKGIALGLPKTPLVAPLNLGGNKPSITALDRINLMKKELSFFNGMLSMISLSLQNKTNRLVGFETSPPK